jgi:hypothetical protein
MNAALNAELDLKKVNLILGIFIFFRAFRVTFASFAYLKFGIKTSACPLVTL